MAIDAPHLREDLDLLAAREPKIAEALARAGYPEPRIRAPGYATLLRILVGQQVSVAAASSMWRKLEQMFGEGCPPDKLLGSDPDALRRCGLSRQKQGYARSLAELTESGALPLDDLPADDEEAIALLTEVKGIGRWTAEIYLLFAEGRRDIWPAGDLAVRKATGLILGLPERPSEAEARAIAEDWRPRRSAFAVFTWHYYNGFETI